MSISQPSQVCLTHISRPSLFHLSSISHTVSLLSHVNLKSVSHLIYRIPFRICLKSISHFSSRISHTTSHPLYTHLIFVSHPSHIHLFLSLLYRTPPRMCRISQNSVYCDCLSLGADTILICSFVLSHLDYCNSLLAGLPKNLTEMF